MIHDDAEDGWLELLPFSACACNGDEVVPEKDAGDMIDLKQSLGQWRFNCLSRIFKFTGRARQYRFTRQELQGGGIWRGFGLNKHGMSFESHIGFFGMILK